METKNAYAKENRVQYPCYGFLHLDGWAGRSKTKVKIIGETPKKYKIEALVAMDLAGRNRTIKAGETALVPKYAISMIN